MHKNLFKSRSLGTQGYLTLLCFFIIYNGHNTRDRLNNLS